MQVRLVRVRRRPGFPLWAAAVVAVWGALILTAVLAAPEATNGISLCWFRRVTGVPCPTCGGTRAALDLLEGRLLEGRLLDAVARNPLLFLLEVALLGWLALRIGFGRTVDLRTTGRRTRILTWMVAGVLFVLNWVYVIIREGGL